MSKVYRLIKTAPGIGDSIWLFQKLINAPNHERFAFQISNQMPQRGKQIFDLCPAVSVQCTYEPNLPYKKIKACNVQNFRKDFKDIKNMEFYLSANQHLEAGKRIEQFLPDLPTSYTLPFATEDYALDVEIDFPDTERYIGIYGSAYSTARNWGAWTESEWFDLISRVHKKNKNFIFVQIGAEWDVDMATELSAKLTEAKIPYVSTIGKPLGYVIELMKILDYGFYFPSGLGILSGILHRPSTMFYSAANISIAGTWADPESIKDGSFKECLFAEPKDIFKWVCDNTSYLNK